MTENRTTLLRWLLMFLVALVVLEAAQRARSGVPLFATDDLRGRSVIVGVEGASVYDPQLGWTTKENIQSAGFNTTRWGLRKNGAGEESFAGGGVLVVGDSFAAGSEVTDEESWPAQLEQQLGRRVYNAGIGGYGTDQMVLWAERLIPILKPDTVVLSLLLPSDVQRAGYGIYGRPKPYFVREQGEFVLKNDPVPTSRTTSASPWWKRALARSMTLHLLFMRVNAEWWTADLDGDEAFERIATNPSAVSCYVLDRLQRTLVASSIRGLLVAQHGGTTFAQNPTRSVEADNITRCARDLGYEVIDEFDSLNAVAQQSLDELKTYYVMHDGGSTYGHMSKKGNGHVATLVANTLRSPAPPRTLRPAVTRAALVKGDGVNRLVNAESATMSRANVDVATVDGRGPVTEAPIFALSATPIAAEHYAAMAWTGDQPGPYTLSVFVREHDEGGIRLQLHDSAGNGAIADFSFGTQLFDLIKIGQAEELDLLVDQAGTGWLRLSLSARLRAPNGSVILQLRDRTGGMNFPGEGATKVVQEVQAPMVEFGSLPSKYCRPGTCQPAVAQAAAPPKP